jgi:spore coat protein A
LKLKKEVITLITFSAIMMLLTVYALVPLQLAVGAAKIPPPVTVLNPLTIPKFQTQLTGPPPVYVPTATVGGVDAYEVNMEEFQQQILPLTDTLGNTLPTTKVWGYGGMTAGGYVRNSPGPSFDVTKGSGIQVKYNNLITTPQPFAVDPTLHWANPNNMIMPVAPFNAFPTGYAQAQSPVPLVPHLHGGEVAPTADGGPDAWWTSTGVRGPGFSSSIEAPWSALTPSGTDNYAVFDYPNINPATTLWYHDHALGITRLNVMSGLAGFYIVRDGDATSTALTTAGITGKYDMPLVFQDRNFDPNGQLLFPSLGVQPAVHPYWVPEFFGEVIMVNGLAWPNMNVDQGVYYFRLLDGSNARFYTISFLVTASPTAALIGTYLPFTIISSDGGYLKAPVNPVGPIPQFTFAPGERVGILMDFSGLPAGTTILVQNTAPENYPAGLPVNPLTAGQVMQFTVTSTVGTSSMPTFTADLNPTLPATGVFPTLTQPTKAVGTPAPTAGGKFRMLTLVEVLDPVTKVPLELLLDGQRWNSPPSEKAEVGSTEEWIIYNPTADSHPIHLHLVQFQLVSRQVFKSKVYYDDWLKANGGVLPIAGKTLNILSWPNQYQVQPPMPVPPEEQGWKDTVMVHPGQITTIRVRYAPVEATAPTPGVNPYAPHFDPTAAHGTGALSYGYVWHCHIIDHEDNEMMRPLEITTTPSTGGYNAPPIWPVVGKQKPIPPA